MTGTYRWDNFVLDLDAYTLERDGAALALEPKAFNVLSLMVQRPGHVFTKQELFDLVWPGTVVTDHALTRVIAQLRRVLGDEAREARYIETVPTRGYRWVPPVAFVPQPPPSPVTVAPIGEPPVTVRPRRSYFKGLTAALAVALVLLVAIAWIERASPNAAPAPRSDSLAWPVQLTTHSGLDLHPSLSPQGDAVAYVSDRSGGLEIYVRTLVDAATETALTSNGGQNVEPAWSPDGRFIAFHSARDGGIWIVPARGGAAKQIAASGSDPAWSPDGRRLAFKSDEHTDVTPSAFGAQSGSTLWVVDADGGAPQPLTKPGQPMGGHAAPAWSRDGRYLAFTVFEGGVNNGVWLLPLDTLTPRLLHATRRMYELVFSPDNAALYAAGGDALIHRLPFDAARGAMSGPVDLIPVPGVPSVRDLGISADGRQLVFAGLALSSQIWAQPVAPDGSPRGAARPLTSDTSRRNSQPAVSPDGAQVAYAATRAGEPPNIWVIDVDGRNAVEVTSDESDDMQPFWFPDGRRIAYTSNRKNTRGIWTIDLASRRAELLSTGFARGQPLGELGSMAEFALSPSARRAAMAFLAPPVGNRVVYLTSLEKFTAERLSDAAQWVGYPAWSPDERTLAVEVKDGSDTHAGVIDVATGALRRLTDTRGQTWVRSWSPDGRRIAAATFRGGVWGLRWIDAATGREGLMSAPAGANVYMRYPDWSPRGDLVVFERGELRGNIWTLALDGHQMTQRTGFR